MIIPSTRWLALDYFTYFFAYGIFLPFIAMWLNGEGLEADIIGILLATGLSARFIGSLMIAPIVKGSRHLITTLRLFAGLTLIFAIGFIVSSNWLWLLFIMLAFNLFFSPMVPLTDALAASWQKQITFDYGKVRAWGSLAFIISASSMGYLANNWGHKIIIYALLASIVIMLLTMLLQPTVLPKATYRQIANTTISLKQLLLDSSVWRFLLCITLLQSSHAAYYGFSSIYWKEVGYSDAIIGLLWSLSIVAEVIVFTFSYVLFRHWQASGLLLLAASCAVIRWSLMASFTALPILIMSQLLHSGTFTVCHLAAMRFISARNEDEIIRLQAFYSALALGAGLAIVTIVVGFVYEHFPFHHNWVFWLMSLIAIPALFIRPRENSHH
ncbi:3-phenylpropionate MFS transporter [Arsenophonus nasoniae]|uniref:3-phenylpropionate MFS transporter n=1 Tax=Arsenophonus nasoniae TaxID=638 RepID=D2TXA8_9GAMM|nr:3-phenylpropionate MFS transporter [Arsenophonus nasoniae]QBY44363.1 putative 3-phenylpropionic acid transporter [Arsenophonus nasoniae]WGM04632.1 3-phenylpropionate MFS transporter [Arsenophonus nasoniae]WGM09744.1 3-phenylpropionate MFS transporter [Arsenophonus nasoniae]WGM14463.1 3-phenylpropionate MFS transporter [Arsenophonus nasoniae]CBA72015.1 probable 3-phenylpropionic acid transporter (MFS-family transporter) [Arsenophonus nasoniae]